jgi:hypothetical protein
VADMASRKILSLTKADKKQNQWILSVRITIENIILNVKIFRITAEKYQNRRKWFVLNFNLITAIRVPMYM